MKFVLIRPKNEDEFGKAAKYVKHAWDTTLTLTSTLSIPRSFLNPEDSVIVVKSTSKKLIDDIAWYCEDVGIETHTL